MVLSASGYGSSDGNDNGNCDRSDNVSVIVINSGNGSSSGDDSDPCVA